MLLWRGWFLCFNKFCWGRLQLSRVQMITNFRILNKKLLRWKAFLSFSKWFERAELDPTHWTGCPKPARSRPREGQIVCPISCQVLFWKCYLWASTSQMALCSNNPSGVLRYVISAAKVKVAICLKHKRRHKSVVMLTPEHNNLFAICVEKMFFCFFFYIHVSRINSSEVGFGIWEILSCEC